MDPQRKAIIAGHTVEEFYWAGKMVIYVNNHLVHKDKGYDKILSEILNQEDISKYIAELFEKEEKK